MKNRLLLLKCLFMIIPCIMYPTLVYAIDENSLTTHVSIWLNPPAPDGYITFTTYSIYGQSYSMPAVTVKSDQKEEAITIQEPDNTDSGFTYCFHSNNAILYGVRLTDLQVCNTVAFRRKKYWYFTGIGISIPTPLLAETPEFIYRSKIEVESGGKPVTRHLVETKMRIWVNRSDNKKKKEQQVGVLAAGVSLMSGL